VTTVNPMSAANERSLIIHDAGATFHEISSQLVLRHEIQPAAAVRPRAMPDSAQVPSRMDEVLKGSELGRARPPWRFWTERPSTPGVAQGRTSERLNRPDRDLHRATPVDHTEGRQVQRIAKTLDRLTQSSIEMIVGHRLHSRTRFCLITLAGRVCRSAVIGVHDVQQASARLSNRKLCSRPRGHVPNGCGDLVSR